MTRRTACGPGDDSPRRGDGRNRANSPYSPAWVPLYELCHDNPYGQFYGIPFRQGEPILTSPPKVIVTIKLGKDDGPARPLSEIANHKQAVRLRKQLARWRNGVLRKLTVTDSIPDVVDIEPEDQAQGLIRS